MKISKLLVISSTLLTCALPIFLTSCETSSDTLNPENKGENVTIQLLNWEDYIYINEEDVLTIEDLLNDLNDKNKINENIIDTYFGEDYLFEDVAIEGFTLYSNELHFRSSSYQSFNVILGVQNEDSSKGFILTPNFKDNNSLLLEEQRLSSEYIEKLNSNVLNNVTITYFDSNELNIDIYNELVSYTYYFEDLSQFDLVKQFELKTNFSEDEEYWLKDENGNRSNVTVIYDTFDTNETMYNSLKTGKSSYDLICPSEYMIQKLAKEGLIKKIGNIPNYSNYASKFLQERLSTIEVDSSTYLDEYTCGYMWGTLGILFNPNYSKIPEDNRGDEVIYNYSKPEGYETLWNSYKDIASIKDSMRDSYAIGILHAYHDEFKKLYDEYYTFNEETLKSELKSGKSQDDIEIYNKEVNKIFNRVAPETVIIDGEEVKINPLDDVGDALIDLKDNIFGFEVDSGKNDIVTGKIGANIAWSGDAVYSMDIAEEENSVELYYALPDLGSNIWFDGWCKTKSCEGLNESASNLFLNFISAPQNAANNMNYIGYTPFIAGDDIFNLVMDWYNEGSEGDEGLISYDINYFFEGTLTDEEMDATLYVSEEATRRQLLAQYPDNDKKDHLAVMQDFGEYNSSIVKMWEKVKANPLPIWVVVILVLILVGGATFLGSYKFYKKWKVKQRKKLREN